MRVRVLTSDFLESSPSCKLSFSLQRQWRGGARIASLNRIISEYGFRHFFRPHYCEICLGDRGSYWGVRSAHSGADCLHSEFRLCYGSTHIEFSSQYPKRSILALIRIAAKYSNSGPSFDRYVDLQWRQPPLPTTSTLYMSLRNTIVKTLNYVLAVLEKGEFRAACPFSTTQQVEVYFRALLKSLDRPPLSFSPANFTFNVQKGEPARVFLWRDLQA